jgi:hypothetical protein
MDPGNSGTLSQFRITALSNRIIFLNLYMPGMVCDRWDRRNLVSRIPAISTQRMRIIRREFREYLKEPARNFDQDTYIL